MKDEVFGGLVAFVYNIPRDEPDDEIMKSEKSERFICVDNRPNGSKSIIFPQHLMKR